MIPRLLVPLILLATAVPSAEASDLDAFLDIALSRCAGAMEAGAEPDVTGLDGPGQLRNGGLWQGGAVSLEYVEVQGLRGCVVVAPAETGTAAFGAGAFAALDAWIAAREGRYRVVNDCSSEAFSRFHAVGSRAPVRAGRYLSVGLADQGPGRAVFAMIAENDTIPPILCRQDRRQ